MEYTSLFEPLLCICLSLILGILIGVISMLWISAKDLKATNEELEKFREMYFTEIDKTTNDN
tara:strand:- start:365 stop:550 length:186 start_codon:yes stop_codon:yes gene_type:complete